MVARYSTDEKYAEHKLTIERIITETDELRSTALQLAEDDAAALTAVTDAYKLPKDINKAKAARSAAITKALIGAGKPPAEVIAAARIAVELAEELLPIGNRLSSSIPNASTSACGSLTTAARRRLRVSTAVSRWAPCR